MSPDGSLESVLKQFALGSLDEQRRLTIEERLVTDPETFDALELVEMALAEAYIENRLPTAERTSFEQHFMSTLDRRRQVEFFRQLAARADAEPAPPVDVRPSVWRPADLFRPARLWTGAFATILIAAVAAAVWSGIRASALDRQLGALRAERAQQQEEIARLSREAPRSSEIPRPAATPTFALAAGTLRSEGSLARVVVPPGSDVVRLNLALLGAEFPSYRATIYTAAAEELLSVSKLVAEGRAGERVVSVIAPAGSLVRGDYQIKLAGMRTAGRAEAIGTYSFRVVDR